MHARARNRAFQLTELACISVNNRCYAIIIVKLQPLSEIVVDNLLILEDGREGDPVQLSAEQACIRAQQKPGRACASSFVCRQSTAHGSDAAPSDRVALSAGALGALPLSLRMHLVVSAAARDAGFRRRTAQTKGSGLIFGVGCPCSCSRSPSQLCRCGCVCG